MRRPVSVGCVGWGRAAGDGRFLWEWSGAALRGGVSVERGVRYVALGPVALAGSGRPAVPGLGHFARWQWFVF